jgi:hypothetical protein
MTDSLTGPLSARHRFSVTLMRAEPEEGVTREALAAAVEDLQREGRQVEMRGDEAVLVVETEMRVGQR